MGVDFDYKQNKLLSVSDIKKLMERIKIKFPNFIDVSIEENMHSAYFNPVNNLPSLKGGALVRFGLISVEGFLSTKEKPFSIFKEILERENGVICNLGILNMGIQFEEKESAQNKNNFDIISVAILNNQKLMFKYTANGSKVGKDLVYRKKTISNLIHSLKLPIKMVEEGEHYYLQHSKSGDLKINFLSGLNGESPGAFQCELFNISRNALIDLMEDGVNILSSGKHFEYTWSCSVQNAFILSPYVIEESHQIYEEVVQSKFPAEKYFIETEYSLVDLEGLDILQNLCSSKDKCINFLGQIKFNENDIADFTVITNQEGHRLNLVLKNPNRLEEIEKVLDLKFIKVC